MEPTELILLEGTVSAVIYRNEENGYTILRLESDQEEEDVTVVGTMPGINPGEGLSVQGQWTHHSTYGPQFKAEIVERRMPVGEKAILEYLMSGAVKGVGGVTARRLFDAFGADVLTVIEEEPQRLTEVKGITPKRAETMHQSLCMQLAMRRLLDFLAEHGLPLQIGMPLYQRYGDLALTVLRNDPYLLLEDPLYVPFPTVDQLALALGIAPDAPLRLEAGLLHTLSHNLDNGHVFLPYSKLMDAAQRLLSAQPEDLARCFDALLDQRKVVRESIAGQDACYLARLYDCEVYVADYLLGMDGEALCPPEDLDGLLERIQTEQGIQYAPLQAEAVKTAAQRQMLLLTGGPGTGKTTSLRGILALFDHLGLRTALTAPTGRAAKRLSETCGAEASTIHRLLETRYDSTTGGLTFAHNEQEPLDTDAVILDEASMVDLVLMQALLAALPGGCRLVLVGDPHQLPSVGPGNVLSDLLRSHCLPTVRLTEIFRQAAASAIIRGARAVDQGACPVLKNEAAGDFFFLRRLDPAAAVETIVSLCQTRLPHNMGIPPEQIQVLSPTRKGSVGTTNLNRALQAAVNPPAPEKREKAFGTTIFREGDRVMQVKNNYDVLWEETDGSGVGMGIFNGDIGRIEQIDKDSNLVLVDFEGRRAVYSPDMMTQLEPAYAVTVHKSQGSEYRAVILAALDAAPMLLTRGVLYTAMTRARTLLIVVGDDQVLARMAANDRQQRRYSGLRARLARTAEPAEPVPEQLQL
ncbi:SF1B family DNA helicase RecD2 [Evtepia sp.]|uniref:SF1B family DNA helicase RecD2 n=1 Tax=Evtepia sp. TaxID=2773933 RepID=UPI002E75F49C|nr:ATP-dependent RecD-like DNA helicase [Evtepia sp.]MEE0257444.1 ATP-dependent RecD-like DNA helicase [Evtepia sp.]